MEYFGTKVSVPGSDEMSSEVNRIGLGCLLLCFEDSEGG